MLPSITNTLPLILVVLVLVQLPYILLTILYEWVSIDEWRINTFSANSQVISGIIKLKPS